MEPSGAFQKKIMVIGEAPGNSEDLQGVQFIGESGQLLQHMLAKCNIDMRRDCIITNSLICRPPANKIPKEKMIEWCRPNVIKAIQQHDPKVIILLGKSAVKSVIGWLYRPNPGSMERWAAGEFHRSSSTLGFVPLGILRICCACREAGATT